MRALEGGSDALVEVVYASRILNANSIARHLGLQLRSARTDELTAFATSIGFDGAHPFLKSLLVDFLSITGIPCPELFSTVLSDFCQSRSLHEEDFAMPATRCRLFVWAITGVPYLPADEGHMLVRIFLPCMDIACWTYISL